MDILLGISAILLALIGLIGCVVPTMPGPPLAYLGVLCVHWASWGQFSSRFLMGWAVAVVVVSVVDYYLPVYMTRKFGGSRKATIGAVLGVIAGLFILPPWGVIIMPFIGAMLGEMLHDSSDKEKALKVAFGSLAAFITGTGAKLIVTIMLGFHIFKSVILAFF